MTEFTEAVYFRSDDRQKGVDWLEEIHLAGYVLEPVNGWVQLLPDFAEFSDYGEKLAAFGRSKGLAIDYAYASEHVWSCVFFLDGKPIFGYECAFELQEYTLEGIPPEELAGLLGLDAGEFSALFFAAGEAPPKEELKRNAHRLAELLRFPNYKMASFDYVDDSDPVMAENFVWNDIDEFDFTDFDALEASLDEGAVGKGDDSRENVKTKRVSAIDRDALDEGEEDTASEGSRKPRKVRTSEEDAPWQVLYNVANKFLELLFQEDLFELTFDTELARDRLTERLTKAAMHSPVAGPEQLAALWLDQMMSCPEVDDVFATDEELLRQLNQAMEAAG